MSAAFTSTSFGISGAWLAEYTLDALGAAVVVFDSSAHITQWSDRAPEVFGVEAEALAGRSLGDPDWGVFDGDGDPVVAGRCPVSEVLRTGETVATTLTIRQVDGAGRLVAIRILPVFSHNGYIRGALASAVHAGEPDPPAFRSRGGDRWVSFEYGIAARIVVDRAGTLLDWNRELLVMTGFDDLAIAQRRFDQVCNLDLAWIWNSLEASDGRPMEGWVGMRLADDDHELPVFGHFRLMSSFARSDALSIELIDPTDFQRPADRPISLLGTEVFAAATVPMLAVSDAGEIVDANEAAAAFLGRPASALRQEPVGRMFGGFEPDELQTHIAHARRAPGSVLLGPRTVCHADGTRRRAVIVLRAMREGVRWPIVLLQLVPAELCGR
jgi:PAS domain-containing protein